ncbi:hypothetical protein C0989_010919 [Termitomyces sp. Mn162]|nr:hypothetical protein C0989_010919 [Termitomyces sp. Mn162]
MEAVVPEEITLELTQILSNLVLGDNEIRSNAEKAVNDRLAQTPELYLLALAQFAIVADTDVMRSFSLVLLRRLLFRPAPTSQPTRPRSALYDHLSAQTITTLERLLLHSLAQEPVPKVRRNAVDTVCDIANQGMSRGRPWHALQSQAFAMAIAQPQQGAETNAAVHALMVLGRTSAYGVFAGAPNLVMDLQPDVVLGVLQRGLEDAGSIEVRTAALRASVAYLESADAQQLARASGLLAPMLSTLASLSSALSLSSSQPKSTPTSYHHLSVFLSILTPLCATHPALFLPHLNGLMHLLSPLILPIVDCGPTPTIRRPFPPRAGSSPFPPTAGTTPTTFTFPPGPAATDIDDTEERDLRQTLRLSALEFMLTLSEARPGMVRRVQGWVDVVVKACLEGMGELDEDGEGAGWESDDPSSNSSTSETDSPPALYEQSLDRLAIAMGGRAVLPPAFQYIPSMLASYDWRVRHAGLMAIAAIGEGTGKVMLEQLGKVVDGQLCTDLEIQTQNTANPSLPTHSVHAHAAAALINFCEGVARDTLVPYLDLIVERLLRLLNPGAGGVAASGTAGIEGTRKTEPKRYVQEQAITTLAMVADASERMFTKVRSCEEMKGEENNGNERGR